MQGDAQTFNRRGNSWVYSPTLANLVLLPSAREDFYFDRAASFYASVMLDATGGIPDPHLSSYICGRLTVPSRPKAETAQDAQ